METKIKQAYFFLQKGLDNASQREEAMGRERFHFYFLKIFLPSASILSKMLGLIKLIRLQFGIETHGKFA
jgi:hypothetical protein